MNMILLNEEDFISPDMVKLQGRRFSHIKSVHRAETGKALSLGLMGHKIGTGIVKSMDNNSIVLEVMLEELPPPPLPMILITALPRPKAVKRLLQSATTLGIKEIYIINSWKVEKSYWQSPSLLPESINEQIELGLEQCRDTVKPEVHLKKLFKPFVEDEVPEIIKNTKPLIAHPYNSYIIEETVNFNRISLAIGPEGGFTDYELGKFEEAGFARFSTGSRILKVETAMNYIAGKFFA